MCILSTKRAMKLTALHTLWHTCTTRAAALPCAPSINNAAPGPMRWVRHRHVAGCLCRCCCGCPLWHTVHAKSYPSCTRRVTGLTGCGSIIRSTTPVPKASTTNGKIDIQGKSNARTINPSKNLQASTAVQHIVGLSTFRFCQKIQNAFPAIGYNKIWSKVGLILDRRSILRPVLSVLRIRASFRTRAAIKHIKNSKPKMHSIS